MKKSLIILSLVTLASCQGTTTNRPTLSQAEIKEEQRKQEEIAAQTHYDEPTEKVPVTAEMEKRFLRVATQVSIAAADLCVDIKVKNCSFDIELEEDAVLNAYANGKKLVISSAMVQFADQDYELANVIAHEYAHNIMQHVPKSTQNVVIGSVLGALIDAGAASQGYETSGAGQKIGQNYALLQYSPQFEFEADYVGLYILSRAGYDITQTPNFWRRMSAADKRGIYTRTTHPTNPERFLSLSKTIQEIQRKKASKQPIVPEFEKQ